MQAVGSISPVTITPKGTASPGEVSNIQYNDNTTLPQAAGTYAVTFDVVAATGWDVATGLSAGTLDVITVEVFNNVTDMKTWLDAQLANTAAAPYSIIALNVNAIDIDKIRSALKANSTKYVNLYLSGSSISSGNYAFSDCTSLANVTISSSITSIGTEAFCGCTSLTSRSIII
jgi:hypothetical protein